jgi:hypothetical protein
MVVIDSFFNSAKFLLEFCSSVESLGDSVQLVKNRTEQNRTEQNRTEFF